MGWLKDLWEGFGQAVDDRIQNPPRTVLKGFVGSVPVYGERGPSVFSPDDEEKEEDEKTDGRD